MGSLTCMFDPPRKRAWWGNIAFWGVDVHSSDRHDPYPVSDPPTPPQNPRWKPGWAPPPPKRGSKFPFCKEVPPGKRAFWGRSVPPCSISPACTFDRAHTQPSIPRPTPWASAESQGRLCPDPKHFSNSPFLHVDPPGNRAWGGRTAPWGVKIHRDGQV